ncbi:MAG: hypothetical protein ACE5I1_30035 [bacterium]
MMGRFCVLLWILLAFFIPRILTAQATWKTSHRLQAGAERDDNIFETPQNQIGTLAGRLLYSNQTQGRWTKTALSLNYSGALQFYPEYFEENKTIHQANGRLQWRLNNRLSISGLLRGNAKIYFDAPFDFANTFSGLSFDFRLPHQLVLTLTANSSRLDYAESDQFDYTGRGVGVKLQRTLGGSANLEGSLFFNKLDYLRIARTLREELTGPILSPLPFDQEDEQVGAQIRLRFGRKYLAHLAGEYLQNDANSFGYSYDQFRISAILGLKLGRPWLLRIAAMRQFKSYREDIAPIIQRTLDPESDESNFLVADLSYNYTSKLTYLIRLAYYKNEAAQRSRFYRKTQLFIGGEFRF